ncbi:hypothetical protein MSBR2_0724 [Methanosarcina barkeri 227]|uniref:DUF304 domain-containing protein n=4 Tax=Methanosarcina barkeri TaxID=2208 RepID=A0A0G3CFA8_METBA|nr:hypothetical protein MSBR2_0724 [Methanosarcina barkeri 227]AKJ37797.1 hypothetical protein MCM1_0717 [Methanosarcina barkeri CM1]
MAFVDRKLNYPTKMSNPKQMNYPTKMNNPKQTNYPAKMNNPKQTNSQVLFREVQKISQIWVWLIIAIPVVFSWYGAYQQLLLGKPFGNNPAPDWMMFLLLLVFGVLFPVFFYYIKLVTEVRNDGIYVRFYPFHRSFKRFPFESIQNYKALTYNPIRDYGGWGIRYGLKGNAYNMAGNRGVLLEFTDGNKMKKLMIGSQIPEKLAEAIRKANEK